MFSRKSKKLNVTALTGAADDVNASAVANAEPDSDKVPHRRLRQLIITAIALVGVVGLGSLGFFMVTDSLANQVHRTPDVFVGLNKAQRPPATDAMTFLLIGKDSPAPEQTNTAAPPDSSKALMLVRINKEKSAATVISLPQNSWVDVPGHGKLKISDGYSLGGPTLLVQTVEALTNIRVDHFGVIGFAGFQAMTDAVGGIDVNVNVATSTGDVSFQAGPNHLNGKQALAYVRQITGLPGGDLGRVQRHQNALRALLSKIVSNDTLSNPIDSLRVLDTLTHWISVDDTMNNDALRSLVVDLRNLRPAQVTFITAPVAGLGTEGNQPAVHLELDPDRAAELWRSVNSGDVGSYVQKYPGSTLGNSGP
jgi:LCP family protein required for cell wall assembly